jgi:hypothetical protein
MENPEAKNIEMGGHETVKTNDLTAVLKVKIT